jgi:D-alanine-D-alanine ligase
LVEEGVEGKEVVCAVLGNEEVVASGVGEIRFLEEFYNFNAKYLHPLENMVKADIPDELAEKIRALAIKAFKAIDGKGLSRIDFFIEEKTNEIIINEINTMPGFTKSRWYEKLFNAYGICYKDLINKFIDLAIKNHKNKINTLK